jgi:hypothetical protein
MHTLEAKGDQIEDRNKGLRKSKHTQCKFYYSRTYQAHTKAGIASAELDTPRKKEGKRSICQLSKNSIRHGDNRRQREQS